MLASIWGGHLPVVKPGWPTRLQPLQCPAATVPRNARGDYERIVRAASAVFGARKTLDFPRATVDCSVRARVRDGWELFHAWTRVYDWKRNESLTVAAPVGDPSRFLRRLPALLAHAPRWALTMQAGASLLAPHAAWENIHIYVDVATLAELAEVARTAGWEQGAGGRITLMRPWYTSSAWLDSRDVRGITVVHPLQLMLDLWHYPVRGREAAEFIADTLLSWKPRVGA
jgi:hypothetical protein